ncbi:hypothetical protein [Paracoccus shandongensis]|uniref:hypothetical protein n=1 Tax=Paracoccus shandongensis TaxID=2816048 RepID=UPI001F3F7BD9|nr:hypothetical protein [Paracoccus shandongensis]
MKRNRPALISRGVLRVCLPQHHDKIAFEVQAVDHHRRIPADGDAMNEPVQFLGGPAHHIAA